MGTRGHDGVALERCGVLGSGFGLGLGVAWMAGEVNRGFDAVGGLGGILEFGSACSGTAKLAAWCWRTLG